MKKILIIIILIILLTGVKVNAYTETGHEDFYEITFDDKRVELLANMDNETKNIGEKAANKSKFWGWKTHYFYTDCKMKYIGKIVYSKANRTSNDIEEKLSTKESTTVKTSYNVSDKLSFKGSGGKKIDFSLANELNFEFGKEETINVIQSEDYAVVIPSNKKITISTTGEGKVTSGYSAKYFFWIRIKSGFWEVVEVKNVYYDIVEEDV